MSEETSAGRSAEADAARETFTERYGPWALIAGASDGIGERFAHGLARRGLNVALLARREPVLADVARAIEAEHGVETRIVVADLTSEHLVDEVARATDSLEVGCLVYNAGAVHGARLFLDRPLDDALALVHLNCRGPLTLVHHFGRGMRARGRGGIVLMSSMASMAGSAYTTTYNATKAFDRILAEGLWHELAPHGVDVMTAIAGATRTPSMLASSPGFDAYPSIMKPEDVAEGALDALGRGPVWVAGEGNRAFARTLMPTSRVGLVNAMSQAAAGIYDLPFEEQAGADFDDLED